MKRLLIIITCIMFVFVTTICQNMKIMTEEEHHNEIKSLLENGYLDSSNEDETFELYPLYNERDELAYFLAEFSTDRFYIIYIDNSSIITEYKIDSYRLAWTKYKIEFIEREDGYIGSNCFVNVHEKDEKGNFIYYYNSPYDEAKVLDEKMYLLYLDEIDGTSYYYVPAVKRGDKFLNLVSMEEFEYYSLVIPGSIPKINLHFDKNL